MVSDADELALVAVLLEQRVGLGDRPVVQRDGVAVVGEVAGEVRAHHGQAGDADLRGTGLRCRRAHVCASRFVTPFKAFRTLWHSGLFCSIAKAMLTGAGLAR